MLNILKTIEDATAVVTLSGRLDTNTAPELETSLAEILPEIQELTLDFSELDYISSAGLRVLLSAQKQMNKRCAMKLTGVNDTIMEIFEVTGFSEILTIE